MNISNIPANHHFFLSLLHYLEQEFANNKNFTLFLPNQRSCREFRALLLRENETTILPEIKALSNLSFEDFATLGEEESFEEKCQLIDELLENQVLAKSDYLFFLAREIQNLSVFGNDLNFETSFKIALHLQQTFDEIEEEEVEFEKISEIDDSNLSLHRQFTLEFLRDFYVKIKNSLLKKNIVFLASHQNLLIKKYGDFLAKHGSKKPIIIAGSTGSISFSRKLIKAIANQKNGRVILYGFDKNFAGEILENHPQFFLNQLINFLEIDKFKIKNFAKKEFLISPQDRQDLLSKLMLPAAETFKWQELKNFESQDLEKNLLICESKNEITEAKNILFFIQKNLGKKIGIISNNNNLLDIVASSLLNAGTDFNDTRNLGIFKLELINFLLLILELIDQDFNSATLLALLKNPLCVYSKNQKLIVEFEIKILRQQRSKSGIAGIKDAIKKSENLILKNFFDEFLQAILINSSGKKTLAKQINDLINTAENLSQKSWRDLLAKSEAQLEIFEFFEKLKLQNEIELENDNILSLFKTLLSQVSYFTKSDPDCKIQILSTIEARLLNFDLLIISSLNEGSFPQIAGDNWLGKKIKKDLGIDKALKRVGQNAYDFCNYLSNPQIILTRAKTSNGSILLESPFLLKLKILSEKLDLKLNYFTQTSEFAGIEQQQFIFNPKPKKEFRPKKFSITEISKLISDPYFIYAKKILKLKELQEIDFEPSYAEFGSFIHKALEEFIRDGNNFSAKKLFKQYFINEEAELTWLVKFENIFNHFLEENKKLPKEQNYLEIAAQIAIGDHVVNGKIDRVIFDGKKAEIFDYKTGAVATKNEVILGIDPQLTIAALCLLEGIVDCGLKVNEIESLNYWKLSALSQSEIKKICGDFEEIKILMAAAKAGLSRLFEYFDREENGYISAPNRANYKKNEYWHLARIGE